MRNLAVVVAGLVLLAWLTGCSSVGIGLLGGVLGAGAAGGSYEYHQKTPEGSCGTRLQGREDRSKRIRDSEGPDRS
jgi:hypothetical protein